MNNDGDFNGYHAGVKILTRAMAAAVSDGAAMLEEDVAFQRFLEGGAGSVEAGLNPPAVGGGGDFSDLGGEQQWAGIAEVAIQFQPQQAIECRCGIDRPTQTVYGEDQQPFRGDVLLAGEQLPDQFQQQADFKIQPFKFTGAGKDRGVIAKITGVNFQGKQSVEYLEIGAIQFSQFRVIGQSRHILPGQRQASGEDQAIGGGIGRVGGHGAERCLKNSDTPAWRADLGLMI